MLYTLLNSLHLSEPSVVLLTHTRAFLLMIEVVLVRNCFQLFDHCRQPDLVIFNFIMNNPDALPLYEPHPLIIKRAELLSNCCLNYS